MKKQVQNQEQNTQHSGHSLLEEDYINKNEIDIKQVNAVMLLLDS